MDSQSCWPKTLGLIIALMIVLVSFTPVTAEGLLGTGLPGFPSFGANLGGPSACGETPCRGLSVPVFYCGWGEDRIGTSYELSKDDYALGHRFPVRGIWLGLGETVGLADNVDAVLSAWALVQSKSVPMSESDDGYPYEWKKTPTNWYFFDGMFAYKTSAGFAGLAGFRYEHYTSHFRRLKPPSSTDSGDVRINNYIPLVGVQWQYRSTDGNLLFRTVGFPRQFGRLDLIELFTGLPFEASGDYKNGYFLEVFSEYSRKLGNMSLGLFARWNLSHAESTVKGNDVTNAIGGLDGSYDFSLQRTTWTLGGSMSLQFDMPLL